MLSFTLKRISQLFPVFIGATLLVYFLVFATPGDPIAALSGGKPMSDATKAALTAQYNLDKPFWVQYGLYLKNLVTFSRNSLNDENGWATALMPRLLFSWLTTASTYSLLPAPSTL